MPNEFGHEASRSKISDAVMYVDAWGTGPYVISVAGKSYRFEDSDRFGPALVKRNGEPCANPWPGERSPFWRAHRIWVRQGRRCEADAMTCIWSEPRPMKVKRITGRHVMLVEPGDEDGMVEVIGDASPSDLAEFFKRKETKP